MKFYVHKLGCPKNEVDADYIAARLIAAGHTPVDDPNEAETIIVNTCGFIQAAKEESINAILDLAQLKNSGSVKRVYATGCLTQRYGDELLTDMNELDGAFGLGALDSIADAVTDSSRLRKTVRQDVRDLAYLDWNSRHIGDGLPYAYLKISDGCDRKCSYCAIPLMRGKYRSRPFKSILNEAEFLAANGKRELILVSQEATLWGSESGWEYGLVDLLDALGKVTGIEWIRLLYLHPARTSDNLIKHLAAKNKTVNYFDLPLQHINSDILRSMKRETRRDTIERLLAKIREYSPDAVIRASFMVGFPGETEAHFDELCEFVEDNRFDRVGVLAFSAEEGTSAATLPDQIPDEIKIERQDRLMMLQMEIAFERNNSLIGNIVEVIIDTVETDGPAVGRTRGDCPEIDQEVIVVGGQPKVGEFCRVRIEQAEGYDLKGTVVTAKL
ncbi:MAG: 30S ribosomal protein S12 methylthiotransferase RimO [candidate division Zixibacteria bacterium]|nr:30S ribosomal protein S12 methylthiotransferase RimO [candidate division Zixibacteria bacterium]